jgi:hypothetical protein
VKIRLSDPDRERLGCPEWLDVALALDVADAEALEAAGGDWTLYPAGGPSSMRVRTWVALHRAGVTVTPFNALHFDLLNLIVDEQPPVGKAPSARSGSGTRSRSPASARRTRSKT